MKTQIEIMERINNILANPTPLITEFKFDVLVQALTFDHAMHYLKPETTKAQWLEALEGKDFTDPEVMYRHMGDYLDFAFGKALNHRGLSAERSVYKLTEYAWILDREDVVERLASTPYPNYGVPKLFVINEMMGFGHDVSGSGELVNMAQGKPCRDGCDEGCVWGSW